MARNTPPTSMGAKTALGALITLSILVVVALASAMFGQVAGEEFNPYTFQRRRFYYFEIPLIHWQVWPLVRNAASGSIEDLVSSNKYVVTKASDPEEWHLMWFRRSAATSPPFDAAILKTYLDARNSQAGFYWHDWSLKHTKLAAILWPAVARCSQLNLYIVIPHLFDLARSAEDVPTFQKDVNTILLTSMIDHAKRATEAKDYETTVMLCTSALEIDGKHRELLTLRAEAYHELKLPEKAAADEAVLKDIPSNN